MDEPAAATLTAPPGATAPAPPATSRRRGLWQRYVTDVRRDTDATSAAYRATTPADVADRKLAAVLVTAAVSLTLLNFLSDRDQPGWLLSSLRAVGLDAAAAALERTLTTSAHAQFWQLALWAVMTYVCYVGIPLLVVRFVLRERVRDYGLRVRGVGPHGRVYAALFALSVPAIALVSFSGSFQAKYPFYDLAPGEGLWPYLWAWWALYALQFVALEFFFRGFLVHGLAPRLGFAAVFVMAVPYNMLHYGKPMLEAFAAIGGGVVLGTLSLKTRSIWWGAALHIAIAATMDVLALWHLGVLF
jgi:membrane protease YdiL (CAAX protease family)